MIATHTARPARIDHQGIVKRWHAGKPCACGARTSAVGSYRDAFYGRNGLSIVRSEVCATCTCGAVRRVKPVRGILVADHVCDVCDARCTNATGHDCECSCGGLNHGKG